MIWKRLKYVIYMVFLFSLYDTLFNVDLSFLRFASVGMEDKDNGIEHKPRQVDDPFLIQRII